METLANAFLTMLVALFIVLPAAIFLFLIAVWFGLFVLTPWIRRALDRGASEDEDTRD